jgi:DNA-3-methyladenine glycosylase II
MAMLDAGTDADVRRDLTAVLGIGRCTADMFLPFALCRPDVLPPTDPGTRVAVGRLLNLPGVAEPNQVERAADSGGWHPFASAARLHL